MGTERARWDHALEQPHRSVLFVTVANAAYSMGAKESKVVRGRNKAWHLGSKSLPSYLCPHVPIDMVACWILHSPHISDPLIPWPSFDAKWGWSEGGCVLPGESETCDEVSRDVENRLSKGLDPVAVAVVDVVVDVVVVVVVAVDGIVVDEIDRTRWSSANALRSCNTDSEFLRCCELCGWSEAFRAQMSNPGTKPPSMVSPLAHSGPSSRMVCSERLERLEWLPVKGGGGGGSLCSSTLNLRPWSEGG